MLSDQIRVMNEGLCPSRSHFNLRETTRTINPSWASDGNEIAMKRSLRKGGYAALNVYFLKDLGGAIATSPTNAAPGSTTFIRDGCSVLSSSVPGGSGAPYDLGKTATHEVGHWMGLFHTFQGGCSGQGDYVSDTPPQRSPSSGCPVGRDSCPGGGVDPIHNYMDYSVDSCMNQFTRGQGTRMSSMWRQFRAGK
ncbi:metalloprotease 1 [Coccidioides immitis H538.4]|uniref:Metalloprotease 1 n=1 Tax=Coccidioides immitis H538.4 TaxID=396776 RepID=A0A0J8S3K0_COCIT|nr:metalloprotease 1 [Coccidioides immitis H538.4]